MVHELTRADTGDAKRLLAELAEWLRKAKRYTGDELAAFYSNAPQEIRDWAHIRPALQKHFRPDLPERFPGSRII